MLISGESSDELDTEKLPPLSSLRSSILTFRFFTLENKELNFQEANGDLIWTIGHLHAPIL